MENETVINKDDSMILTKPIKSRFSSKSLSTECSDIPCVSNKLIKFENIEELASSTHNSSKFIHKLKSISIPVKQKMLSSIKDIDTLIPICGIDEVCISEEDSPLWIQTYNRKLKINSEVSKLTDTDYTALKNTLKYESCALPMISEGEDSFVHSKKKVELRINQFLDHMKVQQVFPSEINSVKLALCINKCKPLVPKLCMGNSSLFLKRQSSKEVPMSKLI